MYDLDRIEDRAYNAFNHFNKVNDDNHDVPVHYQGVKVLIHHNKSHNTNTLNYDCNQVKRVDGGELFVKKLHTLLVK